MYGVQGCSIRGPAKNSGSRTFTHFNKFAKFRSEFGQSLTNFKESVKLYSMRLSKLQGTAAPPNSVPLFPCSKSNKFNDLYVKYDLCSVSGQEVFLGLKATPSHISELLRTCTMRHLHCTWRFSFFCSTLMTWSHSSPFIPPIIPPIIIYRHAQ